MLHDGSAAGEQNRLLAVSMVICLYLLFAVMAISSGAFGAAHGLAGIDVLTGECLNTEHAYWVISAGI